MRYRVSVQHMQNCAPRKPKKYNANKTKKKTKTKTDAEQIFIMHAETKYANA